MPFYRRHFQRCLQSQKSLLPVWNTGIAFGKWVNDLWPPGALDTHILMPGSVEDTTQNELVGGAGVSIGKAVSIILGRTEGPTFCVFPAFIAFF